MEVKYGVRHLKRSIWTEHTDTDIKSVQIIDVKEEDMSLFEKISSNPDHRLYELLSHKRQKPL